MRAGAALLGAWLALGCDRAPEPSAPPPPPAALAAPSSGVASRPEPSGTAAGWRLPAARRLVALGDVHGDLEATRAALRLGGVIDAEDDWIGGDSVVVQTGDQLDRGDDEREILELLSLLGRRAREKGGALHVLNGNHETMNVQGDFRYVTPGGARDFVEFAGQLPGSARVPEALRGRAAAFFPGGPYARRLAERPLVLMVGTTVFAHGGVLPEHVRYGIDAINREASAWMRGQRAPTEHVSGEQSPVWTRRYSEGEPGAADCQTLAEALRLLGAERMVVGHTPQRQGPTSACEGKVWRIDVGMSHHYGGRPAALIIEGGAVRAVP